MATTVTETVGATSRDYATMGAWEAATDNDLVTADEIRVGECYADGDFNLGNDITILGATTDTTRYRVLRAAAGEEFDPSDGSGVYAFSTGTSRIIRVQEDNVRLEHLGLEATGAGASGILCQMGGTIQIDSVAVYLRQSSNQSACVTWSNGSGTVLNTIAIGSGGSGGASVGFNSRGGTTKYNCLAYKIDQGGGVGNGFMNGSPAEAIRNCASVLSGDEDFDTGDLDADVDYCISGDDTVYGTNSVTGAHDPADLWTTPGSGDFTVKAGSALIDAGEDLSGIFTTDFAGDTHGSSGDWEIGPFDFAAGGGPTVVAVDILALTIGLESTTILGSAGVTHTPIETLLKLESATIRGSTSVAHVPIEALLEVESATIRGGTGVTPIPIEALLEVESPTLLTNSVHTAVSVRILLGVVGPAILAGGSVSVIPDPIRIALSIQEESILSSTVLTVSPISMLLGVESTIASISISLPLDSIDMAIGVQPATVSIDAIVTSSIISIVVDTESVTSTTSSLVTPVPVETLLGVVGPASVGSDITIISPSPIDLSIYLEQSTQFGSVLVSPVPIRSLIETLEPSLGGGVIFSLSTIDLSISTTQVSIIGDSLIVPSPVSALLGAADPSIQGLAVVFPSFIKTSVSTAQATSSISKTVSPPSIDLATEIREPGLIKLDFTVTPSTIKLAYIIQPHLIGDNVVVQVGAVDWSIGVQSVTALITPHEYRVDPFIKIKSRRTFRHEHKKYITSMDLQKILDELKHTGYQWLGLRKVNYDEPCINCDGEACKRCMGSGYSFTDFLVKGYTWVTTPGVEFYTEPGRISTQIRNIVIPHDRHINKNDYILELSLDDSTGVPVDPYRIRRVFIISSLSAKRGTNGKLMFWHGIMEERTLTDGRSADYKL